MQDYRRKILRLFKPKETDQTIAQAIQKGQEYEAMLKLPAWKDLESWISDQKKSHGDYLETTTRQATAWSVIKLFNTFTQYLAFLHERRAYNKMISYITITIENGRQKAELAAKREQQRERSAAKKAKA